MDDAVLDGGDSDKTRPALRTDQGIALGHGIDITGRIFGQRHRLGHRYENERGSRRTQHKLSPRQSLHGSMR
jgi:hypothetical protein